MNDKRVEQAREAIRTCKWLLALLFGPMIAIGLVLYPRYSSLFAPGAGPMRTLIFMGLGGVFVCVAVILALRGIARG